MEIVAGLVPVVFFLATLLILDSYKLVALRPLITTILMGCMVAVAAYFVNTWLIEHSQLDLTFFTHNCSPIIEELFKAAFVIYLLSRKRIGFMVDAAIYGFAVGAGFAVTENVFYFYSLAHSNLYLWLIRGLGTAMMHGATTAIFGIVSKNLSERHTSSKFLVLLPGLLAGIVIHAVFNRFFVPAIVSTVIILVMLPSLMVLVFSRSEKATRHWLGVGFDTDRELLTMLTTGDLADTKIGLYLQSLQSRFRGEVLADMLCFLRIHLELAIGAKGILLMREAGFNVNPDQEIRDKFQELKYLDKSLGKTGKLAIHPFLHTSNKDLWQLHMLDAQ